MKKIELVFLFVTFNLCRKIYYALYFIGIEWGNRLGMKNTGELVKLFQASGK